MWQPFETAPIQIRAIDHALSRSERYDRGVFDCMGTMEDKSPVVVARRADTGEAIFWCKLDPLPEEK